MRSIAHVDLDAFFASVEIRDHPELKGRPVVVGWDASRGVVAAASYEARRFGIHSAMPMRQAHALCQDLVVMPVRHAYYSEVSAAFFEILGRFSPLVERLSIDEAFIDLTGTQGIWGPPAEAMTTLRRVVSDELGLAVSVGIAPVKFAAKIASEMAKPDGLRVVEALQPFLDPLPISKLWGVGKVRQQKLAGLAIRRISDVHTWSEEVLARHIGVKAAVQLKALSRGEDLREVVVEREVKSMSVEETFAVDVRHLVTLERHLLGMAEKLAARLRAAALWTEGVSLKLRDGQFQTLSRQMRVDATDDGGALFEAGRRLLREHWHGRPIRLLGLGAHRPIDEKPLRLFAPEGEEKRQRLNAALDALKMKHGGAAPKRALLLGEKEGE